MHTPQNDPSRSDRSHSPGKLYVVGIGPGGALDRTHRAEEAIRQSSVIVGYAPYLECIPDLIGGKELISTGMKQETVRCKAALEKAQGGAIVSFVSSGDSGIYGMAGLALEMASAEGYTVPIEIIPAVSAANAAAARLGAPLMLDYATISLSDLLVPWENIVQRIRAVAAADLVVALYNPKSKKRIHQIEEVAEIFRQHRLPATPVGIVTSASYSEEKVILTDLEHFLEAEIGMKSIVIIGNKSSKVIEGRFVTPRGYHV